MTLETDIEQINPERGEPVRFWNRPLVLVLVSIFLSSGITATGMSIGWKASIDTFAAVNTVKMQQHEERLSRLETDDNDRIKASDLALRDQVIDAKLALIQSEISAVKEQIGSLRVSHR